MNVLAKKVLLTSSQFWSATSRYHWGSTNNDGMSGLAAVHVCHFCPRVTSRIVDFDAGEELIAVIPAEYPDLAAQHRGTQGGTGPAHGRHELPHVALRIVAFDRPQLARRIVAANRVDVLPDCDHAWKKEGEDGENAL